MFLTTAELKFKGIKRLRLRHEDRLKRFYCYLDLELCLITRMERFHAVTSIYANLPEQKKAGLLKKEDYFGTPTCPPFYCLGRPIWPP